MFNIILLWDLKRLGVCNVQCGSKNQTDENPTVMYVFQPHLTSLEAQTLALCEPNLHFRLPCIEEGDLQKGQKITIPLPPVRPVYAGVTGAHWSKPIDLGNLFNDVSRSKSGIRKLFLVLNFEYYLDFIQILGRFSS